MAKKQKIKKFLTAFLDKEGWKQAREATKDINKFGTQGAIIMAILLFLGILANWIASLRLQ